MVLRMMRDDTSVLRTKCVEISNLDLVSWWRVVWRGKFSYCCLQSVQMKSQIFSFVWSMIGRWNSRMADHYRKHRSFGIHHPRNFLFLFSHSSFLPIIFPGFWLNFIVQNNLIDDKFLFFSYQTCHQPQCKVLFWHGQVGRIRLVRL